MAYRKLIIPGYSGPDFWKWLDLMPKHVRDELNAARDIDECFYLWQNAINEYGDQIERKINEQISVSR